MDCHKWVWVEIKPLYSMVPLARASHFGVTLFLTTTAKWEAVKGGTPRAQPHLSGPIALNVGSVDGHSPARTGPAVRFGESRLLNASNARAGEVVLGGFERVRLTMTKHKQAKRARTMPSLLCKYLIQLLWRVPTRLRCRHGTVSHGAVSHTQNEWTDRTKEARKIFPISRCQRLAAGMEKNTNVCVCVCVVCVCVCCVCVCPNGGTPSPQKKGGCPSRTPQDMPLRTQHLFATKHCHLLRKNMSTANQTWQGPKVD